MDRADLIKRISRTWANNATAHAIVLAGQDPSWGTETFELAGGHVVLCGPGLYVNRALAVGFERPVDADDFDVLEERSAVVGVPPSIELVPTADHSIAEHAGARGYAIQRLLTTHIRSLVGTADSIPVDPTIVIERADDGVALDVWRNVAAEGFAVGAGEGRRASDAFAAAAAALDGAGFLLARDATDARPLGCASLTIRDGLATLGSMTTLPSERRRGVQAALINHRLRLAAEAGCDLAASSSVPANASERNLVRAGFRPLYETVILSREPRASGRS
jgi:GNAT superfamily N-acetyltransferase